MSHLVSSRIKCGFRGEKQFAWAKSLHVCMDFEKRSNVFNSKSTRGCIDLRTDHNAQPPRCLARSATRVLKKLVGEEVKGEVITQKLDIPLPWKFCESLGIALCGDVRVRLR